MRTHFAIALACLIVGLAIFHWSSGPLRNYGGDAIVVIFLYSLIRATTRLTPIATAVIVLTAAIVIESLPLIVPTSTENWSLLLVGTTFDPIDLAVYTASLTLALTIDIQILRS